MDGAFVVTIQRIRKILTEVKHACICFVSEVIDKMIHSRGCGGKITCHESGPANSLTDKSSVRHTYNTIKQLGL
ncbi:hypothetical protein PBCV1_a576R [Paramecium bursaria Chlorella virus 1]|uniref:Uncharacterized protein n=1 Tax=Paramecium bursaria Chlorella virus 1 TaxID=10506 RepID=O41058_PBCV1|nr:hypothetical protein PBCV1_a576R [Paramecium bursaria Chlorella virus 1]AAC97006.1 hypothetical protein [Paramecium bursaria Chlorella virus 1]